MEEREAEQILDWLTGSYGKRLEENERMVWITTLVGMDAGRAMEVALLIGKNGERFPSVPEFRRAVRGTVTGDESWRDQPAEPLPIPDWVHVWYWSINTRDDHRPFPQFIPKPSDSVTESEYEIIRQEWEAAGSPKLGNVRELLQSM